MLTPGYKLRGANGETSGLGGNIDGRSDAWVDAWRAEFVRARVDGGAAGLGEFNFVKENARRHVVFATVEAIAEGLTSIAR